MEKLRVEPCIDAGAADTDRKVSLEDDSLRMGICADFRKLLVEVVLDKAPEIYVGLVGLAECRNLLPAVLGIAFPLGDISRTVLVTEDSECSIWQKPTFVFLYEFLIRGLGRKSLEGL